jgi:hypothetical protein
MSITFSGEPQRVLACHCDYCQRRTGNISQVSAWFERGQVVAEKGEYKVFNESEAPLGIDYKFCTTCGSTVHWAFDFMPDIVGVAVGCFVDADFPKPQMEIQTQYRHAWVDPLEDVEQFERFPQNPDSGDA